MVLRALGMRGHVSFDSRGVPLRYRYGRPGATWSSNPAGTLGTSGELCQREFTVLRSCRDGAAPTGRNSHMRVLLAGWLDPASIGVVSDGGAHALMARLQRELDEDGCDAIRRLRGDFIVAHLSPAATELRLYRGATSMLPLFWRAADGLSWATDPLELLDSKPQLSDVAFDLLPMLIAERGFPPDRSWFAGIHRLPAGMCLTLRSGERPTAQRFDQMRPAAEVPDSLSDAATGLRQRLHDACARLLPTGDPVVLLLSGGVDSGMVAHILGEVTDAALGLHFTMEFPGFDDDRRTAAAVADACGLAFAPYDMAPHIKYGGDSVAVPSSGALPQTHTPLQSMAVAGRTAQSRGASFVMSGLMADQIFAHDAHRGIFDMAGASVLNPLAVGEPLWQIVRRTVRESFAGATAPRTRDFIRYARALRADDATVALPSRDIIVHPVGLTDEAAAQVTDALRAAATRTRDHQRDGAARHGLPQGLSAVFEIEGFLNSPNLQAASLNDLLPRQCMAASPYADREVIEYALALPGPYRVGFGYGVTVDKLALRVASADTRLPRGFGARTQQALLDAFPAVWVNQNIARCRSLLGADSRLCAVGVLSESFVQGLTSRSAHRYGAEITTLCVLESWLRGLAP